MGTAAGQCSLTCKGGYACNNAKRTAGYDNVTCSSPKWNSINPCMGMVLPDCPDGEQCTLKCISTNGGNSACVNLKKGAGWWPNILCDGNTACQGAVLPDCPLGRQCSIDCDGSNTCSNLNTGSSLWCRLGDLPS